MVTRSTTGTSSCTRGSSVGTDRRLHAHPARALAPGSGRRPRLLRHLHGRCWGRAVQPQGAGGLRPAGEPDDADLVQRRRREHRHLRDGRPRARGAPARRRAAGLLAHLRSARHLFFAPARRLRLPQHGLMGQLGRHLGLRKRPAGGHQRQRRDDRGAVPRRRIRDHRPVGHGVTRPDHLAQLERLRREQRRKHHARRVHRTKHVLLRGPSSRGRQPRHRSARAGRHRGGGGGRAAAASLQLPVDRLRPADPTGHAQLAGRPGPVRLRHRRQRERLRRGHELPRGHARRRVHVDGERLAGLRLVLRAAVLRRHRCGRRERLGPRVQLEHRRLRPLQHHPAQHRRGERAGLRGLQ